MCFATDGLGKQISRQNNYRIAVISRLKHLQQLDGRDVTEVFSSCFLPQSLEQNFFYNLLLYMYIPVLDGYIDANLVIQYWYEYLY
jgi:hypothetical protein